MAVSASQHCHRLQGLKLDWQLSVRLIQRRTAPDGWRWHDRAVRDGQPACACKYTAASAILSGPTLLPHCSGARTLSSCTFGPGAAPLAPSRAMHRSLLLILAALVRIGIPRGLRAALEDLAAASRTRATAATCPTARGAARKGDACVDLTRLALQTSVLHAS